MIVVSNASPLITLARANHLHNLHRLFGDIFVPSEVHSEIVVAGAGRPGADVVAQSAWIQVRPVENRAILEELIDSSGLGSGEISAVLLARQLGADLLLLDERRARRFAQSQGLSVVGCVGLLEEFYKRGELPDLRQTYTQPLQSNVRIDIRILQSSLLKFNLPLL